MKTKKEIKRIENRFGLESTNIIGKVNEIIDRVNELSSPEQKEEVKHIHQYDDSFICIGCGIRLVQGKEFEELKKKRERAIIDREINKLDKTMVDFCNMLRKPEKKEEVDDGSDLYCPICNTCGYIGCCGVKEFMEKHIKGKTNCKYEAGMIAEIQDICDEYSKEHLPDNKDLVEKEEPTREFTKEELKYLRQIVDVEVTLSERVGEKRITDMAKKVLSKIERLLK